MNPPIVFQRLLFYWVTSFMLSSLMYLILWLIMPHHHVFGSLYRMYLYHEEFPLQYIAIPSFFYGIIATLLAVKFSKKNTLAQIFLTVIIIVLTILLSSPFGGALWHYHDMKAGYFPTNWISIMFSEGFTWGLELGWLIIGLSLPYNIIGSISCFFLTKKGAELYT